MISLVNTPKACKWRGGTTKPLGLAKVLVLGDPENIFLQEHQFFNIEKEMFDLENPLV